jgi:hypothetical protein
MALWKNAGPSGYQPAGLCRLEGGLDDLGNLSRRERGDRHRLLDHPSVGWDIIGAGVALYYLSLRGSYASVLRGAQLFEDMKVRERQALEINDNIVQGLSVAKYALDQGEDEKSQKAVEETLKKARLIITELLGDEDSEVALGPGELRRQRPATVAGSDASS